MQITYDTYWTPPPESTPLLPNVHCTVVYVGGYVLCSVCRNISIAIILKSLTVLDSFADDCAESDAKKWIVTIDRGHLIHDFTHSYAALKFILKLVSLRERRVSS